MHLIADFTSSSVAWVLSNVMEDIRYVCYGANAQCDHLRRLSLCTRHEEP